ncbi:MAG: CDP-alcohol phosphatidyltransferase family protein [Phycisphaerae bacterium]
MSVPDPYAPHERRPIAARETRWASAIAARLANARITANTISIAGMVTGLAAGAALMLTTAFPQFARILWPIAALLIQTRLLANLFDGMVAIRSQTASRVGELYNEVPDRVSDTAVLVGLGYALGGNPLLGWIAALAAMLTAYIRTAGKSAGAPHDYCGPMAKQHRMALVTALCLWLTVSPTWLHALALGTTSISLVALTLLVIIAGSLLTAMRRLSRIATQLQRGP